MAELRVLRTWPVQVRDDVVKILEETLQRAKNGEIASIGIAAVGADRLSVHTRFSKTDCGPSQIGAAAILLNRLVERR